ncbi:MAG TPA: M23 family metallopeptidase [Terracidiphilus sp.]|nr:M23 family metallopeptidase [Terracidiphilus sp.]
MLRKRYYILFVARDDDGRVRKIPVPLRYAYGFVAAAIVGAFTIVGLAGSYTRMLLKTENYNQVRQERESLRKDYKQMALIAHERDVQVASLGALASEVSALYGLRQNRLAAARHGAAAAAAASAPAPASTSLALSNNVNPQTVSGSINQLAALRDDALSGRISLALQDGLSPSYSGSWTTLADAPSLWPVEGRVTSSFGERQDPIDGEGAFHPGIDIAAPTGTPVHATAAGVVTGADLGRGYGRTVELNDGHDIMTVFAHLSALAVVPGQHVSRGQIIGYVGDTGHSTGPHVHYEVRVDGVPVNPYKYLRDTYTQFARLDMQKAPAGQ